ncbi:MAG: glycine betaine ABC transporter substrate-binding protein [Pseudomonadota bacterium]
MLAPRLFFLLVALCLWASQARADDTLRVGSKRFTESYILAEVLAQAAAPQLQKPPAVLQGLGNTAIVYEALRAGNVDLYPEYTGTVVQEILKRSGPLPLAAIDAALAPLGLGAAIPLGFQNGYAIAMREADAARLGIRSLSDLARHPELVPGLSNEFLGRADGWKGLVQHYRLPQTPRALDHGLAYDALATGRIDAMDIYTTDAQIAALHLRVLQDDQAYFPRYDAVVLYRRDVPQRFPAAWKALSGLAGSIDENRMVAMNARAELAGTAFDVIARDQLAGRTPDAATAAPAARSPLARFAGRLFGPDLGRLTRQHLALVGIAVGAAMLLAVPLALLVVRRPRLRAALLGSAGLLQTVPSLALLAALIPLTGRIGIVPALLALMLYALLPILRNTSTALAAVPAGLQQAGTALGMTAAQRLRCIDLPLALPVILAGVRTATSISIGTATIAAFIGAGGYGERIVTGLALNDGALLLAGALPAAALALASEALFAGAERWLPGAASRRAA